MKKLEIEIKAIEATFKKDEKQKEKGKSDSKQGGSTPDPPAPVQKPVPYGGVRRKDRNQPSQEPLEETSDGKEDNTPGTAGGPGGRY